GPSTTRRATRRAPVRRRSWCRPPPSPVAVAARGRPPRPGTTVGKGPGTVVGQMSASRGRFGARVLRHTSRTRTPSGLGGDEALPDGEQRGLRAGGELELGQDVADVGPRRPLADHELLGDVPVRPAL